MQRNSAIVLAIFAFLLGALADRVYNAATAPASGPAVAGLPMPSGSAGAGSTFQGCVASGLRRGMTQDESNRACREILR